MGLLLADRMKTGNPVAKVPAKFYNDVDDILTRLDVFGGHVERNGNNWLIVVDGGSSSSPNVKESIEVDTADNKLHLVGDTDTPGASKVYSTDTAGAKGWNTAPSGLPANPTIPAYLGWDSVSGVHWVTVDLPYKIVTRDTDNTLKADWLQAH